MSDVITISELDSLKVTKEQLTFELLVEKVQRQVDDAQRNRDKVLTELLNPYLPEGKTLVDFMINIELGTLTPRTEEQPLPAPVPERVTPRKR